MNSRNSDSVERFEDCKDFNKNSLPLMKDLSVNVQKLPNTLFNGSDRLCHNQMKYSAKSQAAAAALKESFPVQTVPQISCVDLKNLHNFSICKELCVVVHKFPNSAIQSIHGVRTETPLKNKAKKHGILSNNIQHKPKKMKNPKQVAYQALENSQSTCVKSKSNLQGREPNKISNNMFKRSKICAPFKSKNSKTKTFKRKTKQIEKLKKYPCNDKLLSSNGIRNKTFNSDNSEIRSTGISFLGVGNTLLGKENTHLPFSSTSKTNSSSILNVNSELLTVSQIQEMHQNENINASAPINPIQISKCEKNEQPHSVNRKLSVSLQKLPDVLLNEHAEIECISMVHENDSMQHTTNHLPPLFSVPLRAVTLNDNHKTPEVSDPQEATGEASCMENFNVSGQNVCAKKVTNDIAREEHFSDTYCNEVSIPNVENFLKNDDFHVPFRKLFIKIQKLPDVLYNEYVERGYICLTNAKSYSLQHSSPSEFHENSVINASASVARSFAPATEFSHESPSVLQAKKLLNVSSPKKISCALKKLSDHFTEKVKWTSVCDINGTNNSTQNVRTVSKTNSPFLLKELFVNVHKLPAVLLNEYTEKGRVTLTNTVDHSVQYSGECKSTKSVEKYPSLKTALNNNDSSRYKSEISQQLSSNFHSKKLPDISSKENFDELERLPTDLTQNEELMHIPENYYSSCSTLNVKRSTDPLLFLKEPYVKVQKLPDVLFEEHDGREWVSSTNISVSSKQHSFSTCKGKEVIEKSGSFETPVNKSDVSFSKVSEVPNQTQYFCPSERAYHITPGKEIPVSENMLSSASTQVEELTHSYCVNGKDDLTLNLKESSSYPFLQKELCINIQKLPDILFDNDREKGYAASTNASNSVEQSRAVFERKELAVKGNSKTSMHSSMSSVHASKAPSPESHIFPSDEKTNIYKLKELSVVLKRLSNHETDFWFAKDKKILLRDERKTEKCLQDLILSNIKPKSSNNKSNTFESSAAITKSNQPKVDSDMHNPESHKIKHRHVGDNVLSGKGKKFNFRKKNFKLPTVSDLVHYEEHNYSLRDALIQEKLAVTAPKETTRFPVSEVNREIVQKYNSEDDVCNQPSVSKRLKTKTQYFDKEIRTLDSHDIFFPGMPDDHSYASLPAISPNCVSKSSNSKHVSFNMHTDVVNYEVEGHATSDENVQFSPIKNVEYHTGVLFHAMSPRKRKRKKNSKLPKYLLGLLQGKSPIKSSHMRVLRKRKICRLLKKLKKLQGVTNESSKLLQRTVMQQDKSH